MFRKIFAVAFAATFVTATQAMAWDDAYRGQSQPANGPQIYTYGGQNFCPAGLQPVVLNGVICCGEPTTTQTYRSMMSHPAGKRKKARTYRHTHAHTHTKSCGH